MPKGHERTKNKTEIARVTGHDWKTVAKVIKNLEAGIETPEYKPRETLIEGHRNKVLELMEKGRGWVKISGTYRLSPSDQPVLTAALARDLGTANLDQIVWGSDWPHSPHHSGTVQPNPAALPYRKLDPAELMDMVRKWFDAPREWQQILVDNPARLYEF